MEDHLGKTLFARLNNRTVLTDAGRVLFEGANAGLRMISDATQAQRVPALRARIVISSIESLAEKWLAPRLAEYSLAHSDFRFDLRVEPDPVDCAESETDLRLAYDPAAYAHQTVRPLGTDVVLPLCSPQYLETRPHVRDTGMAAVPGEDLLVVDWGPSFGSRPGWEQWFAQAGFAPPDTRLGSHIGSSAIALDLAREGLGVVLGQLMVADADIRAGRIVALSPIAVPLRHPYCLVSPQALPQKRHLAGLTDWLTERWARAETSATAIGAPPTADDRSP